VKAAAAPAPKKAEKASGNVKDLIAVLTAKKGERPISPEAYAKVKPLLDPKKGGLTAEAYKTLKDNPEVVKAAEAHRKNFVASKAAPAKSTAKSR